MFESVARPCCIADSVALSRSSADLTAAGSSAETGLFEEPVFERARDWGWTVDEFESRLFVVGANVVSERSGVAAGAAG